jgi:ribosomal-protein-alanine N-acetyltransferase
LSCLAEADIDTVLDIETVSFPAPWGRVSFEGELSEKTSRSLVIKKGRREKPGRVIAYLCFRLLEDEMYIMNLAVDPAYRRHGVATFLLGYGLRLAKGYGAKRASLEVRASNHAAIQLYKKMGFCEVGRRRRYYLETQEDAVVMIYQAVAQTASQSSSEKPSGESLKKIP